MNSSEIYQALACLLPKNEIPFYIASADTLRSLTKNSTYPYVVIQNTDRADEPGWHWVSWFVHSINDAEWFDSYGLPPRIYKDIEWPAKNVIAENCRSLQSINSDVCGQYCVYFAYLRIIGLSYENFMSSFKVRSKSNDAMVRKFVNNISKFISIDCGKQNCMPKYATRFYGYNSIS